MTSHPLDAETALPRVQVVNRKHPHFEEYGRLTGKIIWFPWGHGDSMVEVRLENCRHGTDGCFAKRGDIKQVPERPR
jgi:hypothetical protein